MNKSSFLLLPALLLLSACTETGQTPRDQAFDEDWLFCRADVDGGAAPEFADTAWRHVTLPHDWSIEDIPGTDSPFTPDAVTAVSGGFTVGGTGWYRKHFTVPAADEGKNIAVNFDGVYMNADVWVNGEHAASHVYGYSPFEIDITPYISYGGDNVIAVKVRNEGMNCRWYTGSGIYRHVTLRTRNPLHFATWGTYVTTPEVTDARATVSVSSLLANTGDYERDATFVAELFDADGNKVAGTRQDLMAAAGDSTMAAVELAVDSPRLWSPESPELYRLVCRLESDGRTVDEEVTRIGVRTLSFSSTDGFLLNGKPTLLRGGCIHHDHGMLGSKAFDRAEERKLQLLKDAGFNALRLSHNPPSKTLLDVCDSLGIMVIDEAFDMWREHHYPGDFGDSFDAEWQDDLTAMVCRDRNHPCVIMWSIGNEIKNHDAPATVEVCRMLRDHVRSLDPTRAITAGTNAITDDTDAYLDALDVCGYNYCPDRYQSDHTRKPGRIMYASESYAPETYDYWDAVRKYPWVIGDFIWTAYEYIGEASIGWRGYPQETDFYPWVLAYCGDIDMIGDRRPQSYLRESMWSEKPMAHIAVTPPTPSFPLNPNKADWSIWDFPDKVDHWTFTGAEGKPLEVSVYTNCDAAELSLNGNSLGRLENTPDRKHSLTWTVPYTPGTLTVKAYNGDEEAAAYSLVTAGAPEHLQLSADRTTLTADRQDLSFITVSLTDADGNVCPAADCEVTFSVDGDAVIEGIGNANPMSTESLTDATHRTWRGKCMLVVRSGKTPGPVKVHARAEGLPEQTIELSQK